MCLKVHKSLGIYAYLLGLAGSCFGADDAQYWTHVSLIPIRFCDALTCSATSIFKKIAIICFGCMKPHQLNTSFQTLEQMASAGAVSGEESLSFFCGYVLSDYEFMTEHSLRAFTVKWAICGNEYHGRTAYMKQSKHQVFLVHFLWDILKSLNFPLYKSTMFPDKSKCRKFRVPKWSTVDRSSLSVGVACQEH